MTESAVLVEFFSHSSSLSDLSTTSWSKGFERKTRILRNHRSHSCYTKGVSPWNECREVENSPQHSDFRAHFSQDAA